MDMRGIRNKNYKEEIHKMNGYFEQLERGIEIVGREAWKSRIFQKTQTDYQLLWTLIVQNGEQKSFK